MGDTDAWVGWTLAITDRVVRGMRNSGQMSSVRGIVEGRLTSEVAKARHVLLREDLGVLEAGPEGGDVGVGEGGLEGVEDDAVGAVADGVHVLCHRRRQSAMRTFRFRLKSRYGFEFGVEEGREAPGTTNAPDRSRSGRQNRRYEGLTTCQPSFINLGMTSFKVSGAMRMNPRVSGLSAYGSYSCSTR